MLKVKYIPDFKDNEPYLLITSTVDGFLNAAHYFQQPHNVTLNEPSITESDNTESPLSLTGSERIRLADIFINIARSGKPCHHYFDIASLSDVEIIVSYGEY